MNTILLTGATGAVGPAVDAELVARGHRVRALARRRPAWWSGSPIVEADICDADAVSRAADGCDVVIHLASLLHRTGREAGDLASEYERVNVEGTRTVVNAARAHRVTRLVLASSIAVYGPGNGRELDETSPPRPDTPYARTKLDAERVVLGARHEDGQPIGVVLRLAAVYGPRMRGNYERLVHAVARGRFIGIGDGRNRRTLIHERDAARALVLAAAHPDAPGRTCNVSDGRFHTVREIVEATERALGTRCVPWIPAAAPRAAARIVELVAGIAGRQAPVTVAQIEKFTEDIAVRADLIARALGFSASTDFEHGWVGAAKAVADREALTL